MSLAERVAAAALPWVGLMAGLGLVLARRRRAPSAVGFALPVLLLAAAGLAWWWVRRLVWDWVVAARLEVWGDVLAMAAASGGWVLVPVAAMVGRRPWGRHDG